MIGAINQQTPKYLRPDDVERFVKQRYPGVFHEKATTSMRELLFQGAEKAQPTI